MKHLITLSICFAAITATAQTADIEVCYNYKHFHRSGTEQNHQMILKALRKFEDNPVAGLSASLGISITVKEEIEIDKTIDFLETDYR